MTFEQGKFIAEYGDKVLKLPESDPASAKGAHKLREPGDWSSLIVGVNGAILLLVVVNWLWWRRSASKSQHKSQS